MEPAMAIIPFRRKWIPYHFFHANYVIIGISLLVFMLGMLFRDIFGILALSWTGVAQHQFWWQFITWFLVEPFSGHTVFNLVFNMVALVFFGSKVEQEMGSIHYLLFIAAIGALAGLAGLGVFQLAGLPDYPVYGSTFLVLAVLMAYAAFYPDAVIYLMGIFPLRSALLLVIITVLEVILLLTSYGPAYLTHLFGLALAWLYVFVRYRANPFRNLFG
jgi:membrane associated rhomboid family serine protease